MQLMAAREAAVAHCPLSNSYFGDGELRLACCSGFLLDCLWILSCKQLQLQVAIDNQAGQ
jgi:hypothetical protein